jgi:hypothetical protein
MTPAWVPALLQLDPDEDIALAALYQVFTADFKVGVPVLYNIRVVWDTRVVPDSLYEAGFLHIVTHDGPPLMRRTLDGERAARLPWCKAAIVNCECPSISRWDYEESSHAVRTYLWMRDLDYVIVLEKRRRHGFEEYFLVTAFCASGSSTRRSLNQKYDRRKR